MNNATPLLSSAMIVKNEEGFLEECIENIKPFVDEICIIDTGSTDNSLQIAKSAGAKVKSISWEDDFSFARNESLKLCSGRWIFIIDADERISTEDGQKLRHLAETSTLCAYRIWTRNYTNKTNRTDFQEAKQGDVWCKGFPGWFSSAKVRLFPNIPGVKFDGLIHETVLNSLEKLGIPVINNTEILIHHYGEKRPRDRLETKQWEYIKLGEKKIQHDPENPHFYAELARQYADMSLYLKSLEYYRKALEKDASQTDWWAELGSLLFLTANKAEAEQAYKISLKLDPNYFPALRNLALLYIESGRRDESLEILYKAESTQPNNSEILYLIGCVLLDKGEKQKAKEYFYRSYKLSPGNPTTEKYLHIE